VTHTLEDKIPHLIPFRWGVKYGFRFGDWGLGTGDWGLGTGDWGFLSASPAPLLPCSSAPLPPLPPLLLYLLTSDC